MIYLLYPFLFIIFSFSTAHAVSAVEFQKATKAKEDLNILLKQDSADMTEEQYKQWKQKVNNALKDLGGVFGTEITTSYQKNVEQKEETHQIKQEVKQKGTTTATITESTTVVDNIIKQLETTATHLQTVVAATPLNKDTVFPSLADEALLIALQESDFNELKSVPGLVKENDIQRFNTAFQKASQALAPATIDLALKVLQYLVEDINGIKKQVNYVDSAIAPFVSGQKSLINFIPEKDTAFQAIEDHAKMMIHFVSKGIFQDDDFLFNELALISSDKKQSLKKYIQAIMNGPTSLRHVIDEWTLLSGKYTSEFLKQKNNPSITATLQAQINTIMPLMEDLNTLATWFNELAHNPAIQTTESLLDVSFIENLKKLSTISPTPTTPKPTPVVTQNPVINDLILSLEALDLLIKKQPKETNIAGGQLPDYNKIYTVLQNEYKKYENALKTTKNISEDDKKAYRDAYNNIMLLLGTATVNLAKDVIEYMIDNPAGLKAHLAYIRTLVLDYTVWSDTKGKKDIAQLNLTDTAFATQIKLIESMKLLAQKGIAQPDNMLAKIIKDGGVDADNMKNLTTALLTLINSKQNAGLINQIYTEWNTLLKAWDDAAKGLTKEAVTLLQPHIVPSVPLLTELESMNAFIIVPLSKVTKLPNELLETLLGESVLEYAKKLTGKEYLASISGKATAAQPSKQPSQKAQGPVQTIIDKIEIQTKDIEQKAKTMDIAKGSFPDFTKDYEDLLDIHDAYEKEKNVSDADRAIYDKTYNDAMALLDNAIIDMAIAAVTYVTNEQTGIPKQTTFVTQAYNQYIQTKNNDAFAFATNKTVIDLIAHAQLILKIIQGGVLAHGSLELVLGSPTIATKKATLQKKLNNLINGSTKKSGLFDILMLTWKNVLTRGETIMLSLALDQATAFQKNIAAVVPLLEALTQSVQALESLKDNIVFEAFTLDDSTLQLAKRIANPANIQQLAATGKASNPAVNHIITEFETMVTDVQTKAKTLNIAQNKFPDYTDDYQDLLSFDDAYNKEKNISEQDQKLYAKARDNAINVLDNAIVDMAIAGVTYLIQNDQGLKKQITYLVDLFNKYLNNNKLGFIVDPSFKTISDHAIIIRSMVTNGIVQNGDLALIATNPAIKDKVAVLQQGLNQLVNTTVTGKAPNGMFDKIMATWNQALITTQAIMNKLTSFDDIKKMQQLLQPIVPFLETLHAAMSDLVSLNTVIPLQKAVVDENALQLAKRLTDQTRTQELFGPRGAPAPTTPSTPTPAAPTPTPTPAKPAVPVKLKEIEKANKEVEDLLTTLENDMKTVAFATNKYPNINAAYQKLQEIKDSVETNEALGKILEQEKNTFINTVFKNALSSILVHAIKLATIATDYLVTDANGLNKQINYVKTITNKTIKTVDLGKDTTINTLIEHAKFITKIVQEALVQHGTLNTLLTDIKDASKSAGIPALTQGINELLNAMIKNNIPIGAFDKLFAEWKEALGLATLHMKSQEVDAVKKYQKQLQPIVTLLSQLNTAATSLKTSMANIPLKLQKATLDESTLAYAQTITDEKQALNLSKIETVETRALTSIKSKK